MTGAAVRRAKRAVAVTVALAAAVLLALAPVAAAGGGGLRGAVLLEGERTVVAEDADRLLSPASVLKVVMAAVALEHLGPEYRTETVVSAGVAPDDDGRIAGDLLLQAAGDPTWSQRFRGGSEAPPTTLLARAVAARGVRAVAGDLVLDISILPPPGQPASRPLSELVLGWAAPVSALAIDQATLRMRIAPGAAVGAPIRAQWIDPQTEPPAITVDAYTVGPERHDHGTVAFLPIWDRGGILLRGEYPISEPSYDITVADPDPARRVGVAFRTALAVAGVRIDGVVRTSLVPVPGGAALARYRSPPVADWLPPILEDSDNWLAEMLLRQIAIEDRGAGRLEDALTLVGKTLVDRVGLSRDDFVLDDGSGLSSENLITARAVARVLAWSWNRPWRQALVTALPSPGAGTLEGWPALPSLVGKTGTKRHSRALAGYLLPGARGIASDRPARSFAVLLDHRAAAPAAGRSEIARLLLRWSSRR